MLCPGRIFPAGRSFPVFGRRGRSGSGGEREEEPGKCRRRAEGLVGRGRGPVVMDGRGAVGRRPGGEQARRHARTKGGFRRAFPVFVGHPSSGRSFFVPERKETRRFPTEWLISYAVAGIMPANTPLQRAKSVLSRFRCGARRFRRERGDAFSEQRLFVIRVSSALPSPRIVKVVS